MYCFQCQEAAKGVACTVNGVCGKNNEVSDLQDILIYALKGIAIVSEEAVNRSIELPSNTDKVIFDGLFATITNANFSRSVFVNSIIEALQVRNVIMQKLLTDGFMPKNLHPSLTWNAKTEAEIMQQATAASVLATGNEDVRSLRELLIYGVKGMAAYAEHAFNLNYKNEEIFAFMRKALAATTNDNLTADQLVALVMECGKFGVDVMALLDKANTETYGNPEITEVNIGVSNKPGILISGHDLKDLEQLLAQTEGTGVDVYTHSEMLPGHYYPAFKKYSHFVGNYGNAWWQQNEEFESFNGPVLFTTNCIVPPKKSNTYTNRVFTTGAAGLDGFKHIAAKADGTKDFSEIIALAKTCPAPTEIETGKIVGGFAHNQVMLLADKIVDAVKSGAVKKFVVMAGCDGRVSGRSYYSDFAQALPNDSIVLTAGCAKYRYNKLDMGNIGGIPRVLDAGQCNDSYSLAVIALKLKEVFKLTDINELPIAYNIAWYEQKAVIVLLALLYLGVKNIKLGPSLPAFLSPGVAKVLVENFGINGIGTVEDDMKQFDIVKSEVNA